MESEGESTQQTSKMLMTQKKNSQYPISHTKQLQSILDVRSRSTLTDTNNASQVHFNHTNSWARIQNINSQNLSSYQRMLKSQQGKRYDFEKIQKIKSHILKRQQRKIDAKSDVSLNPYMMNTIQQQSTKGRNSLARNDVSFRT